MESAPKVYITKNYYEIRKMRPYVFREILHNASCIDKAVQEEYKEFKKLIESDDFIGPELSVDHILKSIHEYRKVGKLRNDIVLFPADFLNVILQDYSDQKKKLREVLKAMKFLQQFTENN